MCFLCRSPNVWLVKGFHKDWTDELLGIWIDRDKAYEYRDLILEHEPNHWQTIHVEGHRISATPDDIHAIHAATPTNPSLIEALKRRS